MSPVVNILSSSSREPYEFLIPALKFQLTVLTKHLKIVVD